MLEREEEGRGWGRGARVSQFALDPLFSVLVWGLLLLFCSGTYDGVLKERKGKPGKKRRDKKNPKGKEKDILWFVRVLKKLD